MTTRDTIGKQSLDAAIRYAAADRTDPFALRRAVAHMKCGVAGALQYNAIEHEETREIPSIFGGTVKHKVKVYGGMSRP